MYNQPVPKPLPRALLPILRRLSSGGFHSGQALARDHGLSRASVFNLLRLARDMGLRIHAVRGRGYRLAEAAEWLDAQAVAQALGPLADVYSLQVLDSIDSTNTALMQAALAGAPSGRVVCAEHQFSGRGRRGRQWHATLGGSLAFSVLWRFDEGIQTLGGLSLAAGLAVARALNRHSRYAVKLKWPNDVLVDFRKLAGILIEIQGDIHGPSLAVVGIGLNVRLGSKQREAIDQAVIDLSEMAVQTGRNQLLAACLQELHGVVETLRQQGFRALRSEWEALHAHAGQPVMLSLPNGEKVSGVAAGVDDTGAFLLCNEQGEYVSYNGAEIRLRPAGRRA